MKKAIDIHKDLKYYDDLERSKIGIEFFVQNLKHKHFTKEELEILQRHFNRQLFPEVEWDQTS